MQGHNKTKPEEIEMQDLSADILPTDSINILIKDVDWNPIHATSLATPVKLELQETSLQFPLVFSRDALDLDSLNLQLNKEHLQQQKTFWAETKVNLLKIDGVLPASITFPNTGLMVLVPNDDGNQEQNFLGALHFNLLHPTNNELTLDFKHVKKFSPSQWEKLFKDLMVSSIKILHLTNAENAWDFFGEILKKLESIMQKKQYCDTLMSPQGLVRSVGMFLSRHLNSSQKGELLNNKRIPESANEFIQNAPESALRFSK